MPKKATFAAGCFWGVEAAFRRLDGVESTRVGYSGGTAENPSYEDVCAGSTGHAEVVEVEYDPLLVSYEQLLDVFWNNHDGNTVERTEPAETWQYRSVVYFHDDGQSQAARVSLQKLKASGNYKNKIETEILPAEKFWEAEQRHQQYLEKTGRTSCSVPKGPGAGRV